MKDSTVYLGVLSRSSRAKYWIMALDEMLPAKYKPVVSFMFEIPTGAAALISNCTRNRLNYSNLTGIQNQMLINAGQATASLQSGLEGHSNSHGCSQFSATFWCKFDGTVRATNDTYDPDRLFLQVWLHRRSADIDGETGPPGRLIWGTADDYSSMGFVIDAWKQVRFRFTEASEFSVIFFAHHSHNCSNGRISEIYLDEFQGFSGTVLNRLQETLCNADQSN